MSLLACRDAALPRSCELAVAFASSNDGFTCSTAAPGYSAAGVDSAHKPALTSVDLLAIGSLQPTAAVSPKSPTHDRQALLSCLGSDEDAPAADEAVAAEFVELLTGKAARHRVSLITPHGLHAEHSNDGSEAQCSSPRAAAGARMQRGSLAAVSRGAPIGTTGRYSLANVGIVAAQSAGLLPGSPIPVPSLSGDAPGAATGRLLAAAGHAARHSLHQQHAVVALQTRVSSVGSKVNNNRPVSAARASTAGQEQQVSGLQRALTNHSSAGAIAALHKPLKRDDTAIKPVTSGAGHQSPRAPDCSSLQVVTERGSAAFRSTTRQQVKLQTSYIACHASGSMRLTGIMAAACASCSSNSLCGIISVEQRLPCLLLTPRLYELSALSLILPCRLVELAVIQSQKRTVQVHHTIIRHLRR